MGTVEGSIEVDAPLSTVYDQWTRFEQFPRFMAGVEEIDQVDESHLYWRVTLAGATREFHAEVVEQRPDQRIAWGSAEGAMHSGVVTLHRLGDVRTRVTLRVQEEPDGGAECAGEALELLDARVRGDLERFKTMIECDGGAWRADLGPERAEAHDPQPAPGGTPLHRQTRR